MNQLSIIIIVLLLPGILSTIIADKLTVHSKWDSFKFSLYALVFGLASYSTLQTIIWVCSVFTSVLSRSSVQWDTLKFWDIINGNQYSILPNEVILATLLSVPIALIASAIINYKILNKIGKITKISTKYGDENLFSFYLNSKEVDWVYVRNINENLTYQGKIVLYSENDYIQELVLSDVTIFRYEDSVELYSVPTVYLSKKIGEFSIEQIPKDIIK